MSDDKDREKEPTPDSKEPGHDKNKTISESDTTESDLDTQESDSDTQKTSDDDMQKTSDNKPKQPEQSKQDLQKTQTIKAVSSKPQLSKPELSKPELPKPELPKPEQPKPEPPKLEIPKLELPKLDLPKPAFHPPNPPTPTPESPSPAVKKISRLGSVLLKRPKERQPPGGASGPGEPHQKKKWWQNCYDKENKTYCGRTCQSWMYIIAYSIMYLIFLSTFTMIFLYASLVIIKANDIYLDKTADFQYLKSGIGLTATPTTEDSSPMIWYHKRHVDEYQKYVNALERLINQRRRKNASEHNYLGPCGKAPFGYGDAPCVIVRINKNWGWKAKPLQPGFAPDVPSTVQQWAHKDAKLWLNCGGHHPYDAEHIGSIKYFPYPPGFDPEVFPLDRNSESPLIAVQFSNFTLGMSIVVECKLWYEDGASTVDFVLYVGT